MPWAEPQHRALAGQEGLEPRPGSESHSAQSLTPVNTRALDTALLRGNCGQAGKINQAVLTETSLQGIPSRALLAVLQTAQKYGQRGPAVPAHTALSPERDLLEPLCKIPELQQSVDSSKQLKIAHGMEIACYIKTIPFQEIKVI